MRVVFDARHLQTVSRTRGIGRYSRNLLAAFARRAPDDIEWTLLTLGTFAPADPSPLPPHRTRATARLRRPELSMLAVDPLLLSFELARQGDVYHSVQLGLPAIRRFPAVLTIHDLAPLRWPSHYLRLPYSRVGHAWQYALAKHADAIVAVSEATKADVVARLGIHPERIRVIPEAVDSSFQPPSKADGASIARARFGIPDRYVLYVGQFDPRKNMDGLFAAFARAADRDRALRLVIVGTLGKLAGLMRDALARSRVDPACVVITGTVDDETLAALYAGAECLLHAAWLEGFGLTALESLAAGTPVVGYRAGAVAEVVGDAGLLVDERDGVALGEALAAFLDDPPLQAELRARAKPRAARFSWDRAADDTLAIYRSLT
ncbi:MAG TPA: glycosyltransferase family 1 protein [Candidatus Limnocylindria bacterium]